MRQGWRRTALASGVIAAGITLAWGVLAPADAASLYSASKRVLAPSDPVYVKECGSCHMPYSPQLLPVRSWQRLLGNLGDHFGDTATVDAATQQRITEYVTAHAADTANNEQSVEIMHSLRPGDTPLRITQVPYIAALHTSALEDMRGGNPRPKTLAECGVCHYLVQAGNYTDRRYSVTDEAFGAHPPRR